MRYFLLISFLFMISTTLLWGQSINTEFGKNRVQHHDDFNNWNRYETENFITFWYGKGRNIAEPVIQMAELDHDEIQNIMEHRTNDKLEIIVYTDISDLKQSNIGLEETFTSKAGETKIVGNKMFVYFDGNHNNLKVQIREGIASVYLNAMLFGDNFQEIVQNAVLLDLPEWYKQGIISYCGRYWDYELDDELRDILFNNEKYKDFNKLSEDYPKIAGHSMWFYLDQNYGKSSISNLLYLTRITRKLDNAVLYVFNNDMKTIYEEWSNYYQHHFDNEEGLFDSIDQEYLLDLKNKEHVPVSSLKLANGGQQLAYVYNEIGKYRVQIRDIETGTDKTIFKYGHENAVQGTDYEYPIIAWHPNGKELSIVYEHKDVIKLRKYNTEREEYIEQIIPTDFQRIYSMSYYDDLKYIFSANNNGYSDLFHYNFKNRQYERITDDFYDDLDAEVVVLDGKEGILFSSNRKRDHIFKLEYDTILPTGYFDIFFYDLEADDKSLKRLTKTSKVNERYPYQISKNKIAFLSPENGMMNRYVVSTVDPSSYFAVSNKDRNIIRHHAIPGSNKHIYTYYRNGDYNIYLEEVDWKKPVVTSNTRYNNRKYLNQVINKKDDVFIPYAPEKLEEDLKDEYLFQSRFEDPQNLESITSNAESRISSSLSLSVIVVDEENKKDKKVEPFIYSNATASRLKFKLDNFTTKLDNEVLFEGLESYTGNSDELLTQPMGILLKSNVKDLFEDYSMVAGARYPLSFNGSEYFLTFENRKKLIDKKYALYRRSQTETVDDTTFPIWKAKKISTLGMYQLKYPFTIYRSIRATSTLRFDKFYFQSVDEVTFGQPIADEKRLSIKLEYIYDNTIDVALNIKHGTRYKVFIEAINEFDLKLTDGAELDLSKGFTNIIGFDARHYIPFLKHSVIALRAAGATSLGNKKNIYYLGGVNNAFVNPFNENIAIPAGDFAYKTNIFHLRGFDSNVRNGTSYALINSEIRLPVFRYFMGNYGGSSFLRNLQIVLFYDIGTAWHGSSPYSDKNPLNTVTIQSPPVLDLTVRYFRDPLVMGYGAGLRIKLLGYFLRFDYATGVETRIAQKPKVHFSVGMDF
jgi:Tol biopolymer transport system component